MLTSLRLLNFRCFSQLHFTPPPAGALITGGNARGKTSILESVCLLLRLHSPRTRTLRDMIRFKEAGFGISGRCWEQEQQVRFQRGRGLQMQLDSESFERQRDYLRSSGLIVWMANSDMDLVRGNSAARRRYLDFLGTQLWPEYRHSLARYGQALNRRNRLLKHSEAPTPALKAFDPILIEHGEKLRQLRHDMVARLGSHAGHFHHSIGGGCESIRLGYVCEPAESLQETLETRIDRDLARGSTTGGAHRDDLELSLNDHPAAKFASEGQQRTLSIALKLAQGRVLEEARGHLPVYLIDDVFGELDLARRRALMHHLPTKAQALITTTHLDWLDETEMPRPLAHFTLDENSSLNRPPDATDNPPSAD